MSKMLWDQITEKRWEAGVEQVALFPIAAGAYGAGVPWNGVTAFNVTPSGGEVTPLYANNKKYGSVEAAVDVGGTIEAFTYPDEWMSCLGYKEANGVFVDQQVRQHFGLVGKTLIGNDSEGKKYGYKLHILYDGLATPGEDSNATINESVEAKTFSWEYTTTPVDVALDGYDATSHLTIDSTKTDAAKLKALEDIIYGSEEAEPRLPLPAEVINLLNTAG